MQASSTVSAASGTSPSSSSVEKAARLLKAMSDGKSSRLTEIAARAALDKATALRLLEVLANEGFVVRHPLNKLYSLGPELLVLGASAMARFDPRPIVRPSMLRLADRFEDTVILSIPQGNESLCLALEEGRFPIRANYLSVGSRRLLGVGAGSLALLAGMRANEMQAVLPSIEAQLAKVSKMTREVLHDHIAAAQQNGYSMTLNLIHDRMGGLAVPILSTTGFAVAALSVAALSDRIVLREKELVSAFKEEAAICAALWREAERAGGALANTP